MKTLLLAALSLLVSCLRSRSFLQLENVALRHQLMVYERSVKRSRVDPADRILWSALSRIWPCWSNALRFVKPETVIAWRRKKFREHWNRLSRRKPPGRPPIAKEIQELIRRISVANPSWGAPRVLGELKKLGIEVAKSTVERYMVRNRKPPSQTWRTFLANHAEDLVAIDFFTVPTVDFKVFSCS